MEDDHKPAGEPAAGRVGPATRAVLFLIVALGGTLRFLALQRESLWYDELYVVWARQLSLKELLPEIFASEHPPVFNIIGHFWDKLGHNMFWVRSLSALVGTVTIILVYLTAKELFSRRAGLWAAAFAAVSPLLVWYSRDATSYAWVIAISLASLYLLIRWYRRGGRWNWGIYVAVTFIAVFSHITAAILVVAEAAFFLIACPDLRRRIKPWLLAQTVIVPVLAVVLVIGKSSGNMLSMAEPLALETLAKLVRGIVRGPYNLLLGYVNQPAGSTAATTYVGGKVLALSALIVLALAAPFVSRRVRRTFLSRRYLALAVFVLTMVVGPLIVLLLRDTGAAGRYFAWAAPALLILMAAVITAAPSRVSAVAGSLMVAGFMVTTAYDLSIFHNESYGSLMLVVQEQRQEDDYILCFPKHNCFVAADFYLSNQIDISGGFIAPGRDGGVYMDAQGVPWGGYRYGYMVDGGLSWVAGAELEERLARELAGRERFWFAAGTGKLGFLPSGAVVEESLPEGWVVAEDFEFSNLLVLKLYVLE